ncbi:MAG: hypothetical protein ACYCX4_10800 [Bacillota bacterium]
MITREMKFDPTSIRPQIDIVIDAFDRYLEDSPYRGRTKHAVMGPVTKILERAQTGFWSVEDLAGYALRLHEMHSKGNRLVPADSRMSLETGIQELMRLVSMVPITALAKILEKVDYGLYYRRRKRASEWMKGIMDKFEHFLRSRYETVDLLRDAWKDKNAALEGIYPSKNNDNYRKSKGKRSDDIDDFWHTQITEDIEDEEE